MKEDKFKNLVHFIIHECSDNPEQLGSTRLNKTLWYIDVLAYKANGKPVTEETYIKAQGGPVPKHVLGAIKKLKNEGKITVQEPQYKFDARKYSSITSPASATLSDDEKDIAMHVLNQVRGFSASDISETTHDIIWAAAAMGEEIPLFATLAANEGIITAEVLSWADRVIVQQKVA